MGWQNGWWGLMVEKNTPAWQGLVGIFNLLPKSNSLHPILGRLMVGQDTVVDSRNQVNTGNLLKKLLIIIIMIYRKIIHVKILSMSNQTNYIVYIL